VRRPGRHRFLGRAAISRWLPVARSKGVSRVARSPRGFLRAYAKAGWSGRRLPERWRRRREAFIARHMAQVKKRREPLFKAGKPTRRHLALIMWAYSPKGQ
jgi:hypothetical protein